MNTPRAETAYRPARRHGRGTRPGSGGWLALALLPLMLLVPRGAADTSHREHAKQQLAIRAAARDVLDTLSGLATTNGSDSSLLVEDLYRMMVSHVGHHKTIEQSREASRVRLRQSRVSAIENLLDQAATHAHEQSPLPVTRADVLARLGDVWEQKKTEAIEHFLDLTLEPLFLEARTRAVTAQKAMIENAVRYPAFDVLDPKLTERAPDPEHAATPIEPKAFQTFLPWIESIAFTNITVFEENQPVVKRLGEDVLSEIQRQYTYQIEAVRHPIEADQVPPDRILQPTIEKVLLDALDQAMAQQEPRGVAPLYPPFTAVRHHASRQARELRDKRLLDFIARPEALTLEPDLLRRQMESHPENHRTAAQSHKLFLERLTAERHRPLAERYAAASESPAVNQIDVLLMEEPRISKAFRARIDAALKTNLPPLRAELGQAQFETLFPALDAQQPFPDEIIEFLHDVQSPKIDNMGLLREVLGLAPDLAPQPHEPNALLVETEKLVLQAANAQAEPLVRALGAQLRLLANLADENREQLRQDVAAEKPFEEIKAAWLKELEGRWKSSATEHPERAQTLFERTQNELDKTVRQLYVTLRNEIWDQERVTAAEGEQTATPEAEEVEVPEEPPEEDEEEKEKKIQEQLAGMQDELLACRGLADFVFVLDDGPAETGLVVVGHPAEGMIANARFTPAEVEAAAGIIADAVGDNLTVVLEARAEAAGGPRIFFWRNRTPLLRVLVLEHSREMRHLSSILLQQNVKQRIEQWAKAHDVRFRLDWQETPGRDDQ